MKAFFPLGALVGLAVVSVGCSKPAEADGAANTLDGISLESVSVNLGVTAPKQNAQNIATAAGAARAAGYERRWVSKEDAVADVMRGITVRLGSQEMNYSSTALGASDQQEAMAFLVFDSRPPGTLRFTNEAQP